MTNESSFKADKTEEQLAIWELIAQGDQQALLQIAALKEAMGDVLTRPVTDQEMDYLLMRFAYLRVWCFGMFDITDDSDGGGSELKIDGVLDEFYRVVDFGACLVLAPRDLFDSARTYGHTIQSMQALMRYVHKLGWDVELTGYYRLVKAAWYQIEKLNLSEDHQIRVTNFPT